MRVLGFEIRRARRYNVPFRPYRNPLEPRTRTATRKFTYGNVQVNIYSPFDEKSGETKWRFSLIKLCGKNERGEQGYRRSFEIEDAEDLQLAVFRCIDFITRAMEL